MSTILHDAAMQSMKEDYTAFLSGDMELYDRQMMVAERTIDAISPLGTDGICGRQLELMGLQAEWRLIQTLPKLNRPRELITMYELAELQLLMPPSRIIAKDDPFLPHCTDALEFFQAADEETADDIGRAVQMYARLTSGGGSVEEIYRAQLADKQRNHEDARMWAKLAQQRMCRDRWIALVAKRIMENKPESVPRRE